MKHDHQRQEEKDKELLHSNPAHVDVLPKVQHLRRFACAGKKDSTAQLHDERTDVQPNEAGREPGRFDIQLFLRDEEVHHPAENHIVKCVDPCVARKLAYGLGEMTMKLTKRCKKEQDRRDCNIRAVLLISRAQRTDNKGSRLPSRSHNDHPAEFLSIAVPDES